jgi:hypothetical protein
MFVRFLSLALSISLLQLTTVKLASAQSNTTTQTRFADTVRATSDDKAETDSKFAAKIKASIARLGTGPEARAEIGLRNHRKFKGYISAVTEDGFTVVDSKSKTSVQVAYPQVKQVKGNNLTTGVKIAIGVAILIYLLWALRGIANGNG